MATYTQIGGWRVEPYLNPIHFPSLNDAAESRQKASSASPGRTRCGRGGCSRAAAKAIDRLSGLFSLEPISWNIENNDATAWKLPPALPGIKREPIPARNYLARWLCFVARYDIDTKPSRIVGVDLRLSCKDHVEYEFDCQFRLPFGLYMDSYSGPSGAAPMGLASWRYSGRKVVADFFEEIAFTRETLDRRYDDMESGRVTPIAGGGVFARLRAKSAARRAERR